MTPVQNPIANRLTGKVILITGAASGIGAAIAQRCRAEGGKIVCADHNAQAVRTLAAELGEDACAVECDVTDIDAARNAVEMARQAFGRLDGLVHNAAAPSTDGTVADLDPAAWRLEIDVSLTGAFLISKFAVPLMISGDVEIISLAMLSLSASALRPSISFP